ncbi:MAG: ACT domain-containing protein [Candidatus Sulfotelmatobacter sp.]
MSTTADKQNGTRQLKYRKLPGTYAVVRFSPDAPIPAWAITAEFTSITRTADELSIVCPAENLPADMHSPHLWICLKLEGPFPFTQTGVLLAFIQPLSGNDIPIFAVSTYDTDYVFIPQEFAGKSLIVLKQAGHVEIR